MNKITASLALMTMAFAVAPLCAHAQQRDNILWTVNNFAPYIFTTGPDKGEGIIDQAMDYLVKRLTDFDVQQVPALIERSLEMMKTLPNVCSGTLLKNPEREKAADFSSHPLVWSLPNGVITTRERLDGLTPYLNDKGELRLDQVLAAGGYKLAADPNRSYGPNIDAMVRNPAYQPVLVRSNVMPTFQSKLLKLVNRAEYDLIIGYAVEIKGATARLDIKEGAIAFLPIAGEPGLRPLALACSKSDVGRRFIAAADKLLADPAVRQDMAQFYRRWLDAETAKRYDALVKQANATR